MFSTYLTVEQEKITIKTNMRSEYGYSCNEESPMFGDTGLSNVRKYWRTPYVM